MSFTEGVKEHNDQIENVKNSKGDEKLVESIYEFLPWENIDGHQVGDYPNNSQAKLE